MVYFITVLVISLHYTDSEIKYNLLSVFLLICPIVNTIFAIIILYKRRKFFLQDIKDVYKEIKESL